jgi:hypothetical protein
LELGSFVTFSRVGGVTVAEGVGVALCDVVGVSAEVDSARTEASGILFHLWVDGLALREFSSFGRLVTSDPWLVLYG